MLPLAADENFNNDIVRGLLRRNPDLNIVRRKAGKEILRAVPILEILRASLKGFREGYKLMASVKNLLDKNRILMIAA